MPKLTIGMAVYNDFNGVYMTVQALRLYHDLSQVELIVVDNNPDSPDGKSVKTLIDNYAHHWTAGAKYIPYTEKTGTSAPRQKVFEEASGDAVMCVDSHIMLSLGTVERLIRYYDENPEDQNLLSGPMIYDSLNKCESSFEDQWRAEMWGIWAVDSRAILPKEIPPYLWHLTDNNPPFEIPAMGLGLFSCHRDAWLGFNPNFTGFGGEEFYIHNKFRQAGRKCLCLPFLRWLHRFPRPGGLPYPLTRWQKVRNYVIGHQELGLPIDRIYEHFVKPANGKPGVFTESEWLYLLDDPIGHVTPKDGFPATPCVGCNKPIVIPPSNLHQPPEGFNIDQMFENIRAVPRGMEQHMKTLRDYARKSERICEFSQHRESTLALLAGKPRIFLSWQQEQDALLMRLHQELGKIDSDKRPTQHFTTAGSLLPGTEIPECDLLFLDTIYTAEHILQQLETYAPRVKKYVIVFATHKYGEVGAHNGPGLLPGIREYLKRNPQWRVIDHTDEQDGLTVLSCLPEDAPKLPSTPQMALNYGAFLTKWVLGGGGYEKEEVVKIRLDTCAMCPYRTADAKNPNLPRCSKCGCWLVEKSDGSAGKALFRNAKCPLNFWADAERLGHAIVPISPKENPAS